MILAKDFEKAAALHELIKVFGGIAALAGAAGIALAVYLKFDPQIGTALPSALQAAIYGVSVLLSGAAIYCLGAIVDHLKAIRNFQRRQIEIFELMGKNRASSRSGPANAPEHSAAAHEFRRPETAGVEAAPGQSGEGQPVPLRRQAF